MWTMFRLNDFGRVLISSVVVVGFFYITSVYLTRKLAGTPDNDILGILLGALAANFTSVVKHWTDSSAGSVSKDETIKEMAQTVAVAPPVVNVDK